MKEVFIVWSHVELGPLEEEKLIGVYSTEEKARAVVRLRQDDFGPTFYWNSHLVDVDPMTGEQE